MASVKVGGIATPTLSPNEWGEFPRVYIPQDGRANVTLSFPAAQVGDQVVAAVNDGGHFADGKPFQNLALDANHQVQFQFEPNAEVGNYRVSVRHAGQTKIVQFWAGDRTLAQGR